jgi:hypothetical protein
MSKTIEQTRPFQACISESLKVDLETMAMGDGVQRGIMFDTSGKCRVSFVSATATNQGWVFKTIHGQPFKWNDFNTEPYKP